jgi:predicted alpha/beta-hydrolase family hydrolase
MDTPFMECFAKGLGQRGYRVVRFEYPYMASKRVTGKARPPDREPSLRETWLKAVDRLGHEGLVIGGKGYVGFWIGKLRARGHASNATIAGR